MSHETLYQISVESLVTIICELGFLGSTGGGGGVALKDNVDFNNLSNMKNFDVNGHCYN